MTTAFEAKRRIIALLAASTDLTGVPIRYAPPTRDSQVPSELIWVGDVVSDLNQDWVGLGGKQRTEEYNLPLNAQTYKAGDDPASVETRLEAIVHAIGVVLVANDTLGDLCVNMQLAGFNITTGPLDEANYAKGWASRFEARIGIRARLRTP